ncbi:MAG TPA: hypothetical protein VFZ04_20095, partial [Longimicrobiales bacterium]
REASLGTNALIFEGAHIVISVRDVIEQLPWEVALLPPRTEPMSPNPPAAGTATLFEVLGPVAMQIDQIARAASCDTAAALAGLAELELDGLVRQLPGKRFVRAG